MNWYIFASVNGHVWGITKTQIDYYFDKPYCTYIKSTWYELVFSIYSNTCRLVLSFDRYS